MNLLWMRGRIKGNLYYIDYELMIVCKSVIYGSVKKRIYFMWSHNIGFFEIFGNHGTSYSISFDSSHISYSIDFFHIDVVNFFNILFELWFGYSFIHFEDKNIIVYLFSWSFEQKIVLEEFILGVLFGEIFVGGELDESRITSSP